VLTYLIARRQGENLTSRFVSVIEPFKEEPIIDAVRALPVERGSGLSLEVRLRNGSADVIDYDPQGTGKVDVRRRNAAGEAAGRFSVGNPLRTGAVVDVDPQHSCIRIHPAQSDTKPEDFTGRVVHFRNDLRRTAHTMTSATRDGDDIVLTASDDLLVGRARIDAVEDDALATRTSLPLAPIYRGVTLGSATFKPLARVARVADGKIVLATPLGPEVRPAAGDDVWLINVGPADTFELPTMIDETK
jgi:hypothetical protein